MVCSMKNPADGYKSIVEKGEALCRMSSIDCFHQAFLGGCYIGMGGLLSLTVAGNSYEIGANNPGIQTLIYALLFPVNLVIIMNTGGVLFTGATFTSPCAVIEGRAKVLDSLRVIWWSWAGNLAGGIAFAIFTDWCGLLELDGGAAKLALVYTYKKVLPRTLLQNFLRGIGCNWLVCLAVYLCTMAQDFGGKYIAILLPISTFVACGFEHMPANAYLLPAGYIASLKLDDMMYNGRHQPSIQDIFVKNIIMATLGNWVAGTFIMAVNYSFSYGRMKNHPVFKKPSDLNTGNNIHNISALPEKPPASIKTMDLNHATVIGDVEHHPTQAKGIHSLDL